MCLYPKIIKNRKYTSTEKNGGIIPSVTDTRVLYLPVGCGNCIECRKQKTREWQARLLEDIKTNTNGKFITLTFSNESIKHLNEQTIYKKHWDTKKKIEVPINELEGYEKDNAIATKAVRLFTERWRKEHKTSVRHWLVTELGHKGTENIHMHGIIWTDQKIETIGKIWKYGYIWPRNEQEIRKNYVHARTVNYIIKYVNKRDQKHQTYKSIILTSPGIGRNYTEAYNIKENRYNGTKTIETYRTQSGHTLALPIYWRNKIYTEEEREKLWTQKLDKEERWICGQKVDISRGLDEFYKLLEDNRITNKRLGYGTDENNWSREQYEKQRRNLIINTRIQNTK